MEKKKDFLIEHWIAKNDVQKYVAPSVVKQ